MHAYQVQRPPFKWHGRDLGRGDVLRGDDARELEKPENAKLFKRCTRVHDHAFTHFDDRRADASPRKEAPTDDHPAGASVADDHETGA